MKNKRIPLMTCLLVCLFLVAANLPSSVYAQEGEGEGYDETFDSAELVEWEMPREAAVKDGYLSLQPGAFALRFGDFSNITLTMKVRFSASGEAVINYYFRDEGRYGLTLMNGGLHLEKEERRVNTPLAGTETSTVQPDTWLDVKITVQDGTHTISINDEQILTATDENPLATGAILFQAFGETTFDIDDIHMRGTPGAMPPPEGQPEGELVEGEPMEGEPMPAGEIPAEGAPQPELFQEETPPTVTGTNEIQNWITQITGSSNNVLSITDFIINLVLSVVFSYVLSRVYIHWGASLSNRRRFAANFILISVTTTFIILVVRSSVALSLGLVGALSIVRFRSAIKEPEELAYLFFAISIGIGLGDNQRLITAIAVAVAIVILAALHFLHGKKADFNLHLTVRGPQGSADWQNLLNLVQQYTSRMKLLRDDDSKDGIESTFVVEFKSLEDYNALKTQLKALSPALEITFLDNKGIW